MRRKRYYFEVLLNFLASVILHPYVGKIDFVELIMFTNSVSLYFRESYIPLSPQQNAFQQSNMTPALSRLTPREYRSLTTNRLTGRSVSSDSVYTILIRLPGEPGDGNNCAEVPSIRMIPEVWT